MNTLRIENHVHDYESWKQAFDRYEALRRDKGVRRYRITRDPVDERHIFVELDFDNVSYAQDFRQVLARIWRTPRSREQLADHGAPVILDVITEVSYGPRG